MREHPDSRYLTPTMAARLLSVSRQRVNALLDEGKLDAHRQFGHRYATRESVHRYMAVAASEKDMMTVSDVAAYFGVTRDRALYWVHKGLLPVTKSRKRLLVKPSDVAAFTPPPRRTAAHERNTP